jgi:hypothetical protein
MHHGQKSQRRQRRNACANVAQTESIISVRSGVDSGLEAQAMNCRETAAQIFHRGHQVIRRETQQNGLGHQQRPDLGQARKVTAGGERGKH